MLIWEDLAQEAKNAVAVILALSIGLALVSSAIAWPIVFYHNSKHKALIEGGYEEQPDTRSNTNVLWVKARDK